ncbi:hypothetical protein J6590_018138 [Homalodisca vitripennis]|nr:hypothetical protein J6590_018138 [Homalodisca vitripennis]
MDREIPSVKVTVKHWSPSVRQRPRPVPQIDTPDSSMRLALTDRRGPKLAAMETVTYCVTPKAVEKLECRVESPKQARRVDRLMPLTAACG